MLTSQDLPVELLHIARALGRDARNTALFHTASVATASTTGDKTLVAGVANRLFYAKRLIVVPTAAGTFRLWSGPNASGSSLTGVITAVQGVQYEFEDCLITHAVNTALVLQAVTDVTYSGRVAGWYF